MLANNSRRKWCSAKQWQLANVRAPLGFSLLELVVTIAVFSILVSFAAPSFVQAVRSSAMSTSFSSLGNSVRVARSEAIKRSSGISVCAVDATGQCGGTDWSNGWQIYTDRRSDGAVGQLDGTDVVLFTTEIDNPDITIEAKMLDGLAMANTGTIRFSATGQASWTLGTFQICDKEDKVSPQAMIVNAAGTLRNIEPTKNMDGSQSFTDPSGGALCE